MRTLRFFLVFFCLLLPLAGLGLYSQRIPLAEYGLRHLFKTQGHGEIEVTIKELTHTTVLVDSLHAVFSGSPLRRLSLTNLVLHFTPETLLDGKVIQVEADTLYLELADNKASPAKSALPSFATIRHYLPPEITIGTVTLGSNKLRHDFQLQVQIKNPPDAPLSLQLEADAQPVVVSDIAIEALEASLFLTTDNGTEVQLKQPSSVSFETLQRGTTVIGKSQASLSGLIKKDPSSPNWYLADSSIQLQSGSIEHGAVTLTPAELTIQAQLNPAPFQVGATITSNSLTLKRQDSEVALQAFRSMVQGDTKALQLEFSFKPEMVAGLISGNIHHNLESNGGTAKITTLQPLDLQTTTPSFAKLLKQYNGELQINGGLVTTTCTGSWENGSPKELQSLITIREGSGSFLETTFSGLLLQQHLQLFPEIQSISSGYLSVETISNPIPFKDFSIRSQLLPQKNAIIPLIHIESIQTGLFGGIVRSKDLLIDLQAPTLETQIVLNRINLEELLERINVKGLKVSGILDGTITLRVDKKTITVPEGSLQSRSPGGTITYLPPGGKEHFSTIPAYALQALEEFNYKTLSATPRYMDDGTLLVSIHTEGVSPPLKTSREVHLNIDTEQNLLSLLQSLRYSSSLTEEVEKNLQNTPQ